MADEASLLFGEKSKLQTNLLAQGIVNFNLVYISYIIFFLNLKGFEVEFGDSIKFGSFKP